MHDLIVIGGGPAGLTATMYAIQKRLDVLMISRDLGGKTNFHLKVPFIERHTVINGDEVLKRFINEIKYLDYPVVMDNAEHVQAVNGGYIVTTTGHQDLHARALIIATGSKGQLLNVPGERDFMMKGLCYSAISYAQLMIDLKVVVIGDGNLALRSVMELVRSAHHVTLIAASDEMLHTPLAEHLRKLPKVKFLEGYEVKEIRGDEFARSVVISGPDGVHTIGADAIFVERELIPRSEVVAHLVELDPKGHIKINTKNETSANGIYAAGDVSNTFSEQVLVSIGEGAKAALSAYDYLLRQNLLNEILEKEIVTPV